MDERVRRTVETYEENAGTYADVHGGDRASVADMVEHFVDAVGGTGSGGDRRRVLDVGPGPGWESGALADHGFDVTAVDLTRSFLEETRERDPGVGVVGGDMRSLPFAEGAFDGLWACASLLHVPREDVPGTLAEYERVLAAGGVAVASVQRSRGDAEADAGGADATTADPTGGSASTTADEEPSPYDEDRRYFELYEPRELRAAFEEAGFGDVAVEPGSEDRWVRATARID